MDYKNLKELKMMAVQALEEVRDAKREFEAAAEKLRTKTDDAASIEKIIVEREIDTLFDYAAPWRLKEFRPTTVPPPVQASPALSSIEGIEEVSDTPLVRGCQCYECGSLEAEKEAWFQGSPPPPPPPELQEEMNEFLMPKEPAPDAQDRDSILEEERQEVKPDYNHKFWPSPRPKQFAMAMGWGQGRGHLAALKWLAYKAGITVEALLEMNPLIYQDKYMGHLITPLSRSLITELYRLLPPGTTLKRHVYQHRSWY